MAPPTLGLRFGVRAAGAPSAGRVPVRRPLQASSPHWAVPGWPSNVSPAPTEHAHSLEAACCSPGGSRGEGWRSRPHPTITKGFPPVQPLTSLDRTLLGSSSSRVKMSPRFTVSWDPSSNSTCQEEHGSQTGSRPLPDAQGPATHATAAQPPRRVLVQVPPAHSCPCSSCQGSQGKGDVMKSDGGYRQWKRKRNSKESAAVSCVCWDMRHFSSKSPCL